MCMTGTFSPLFYCEECFSPTHTTFPLTSNATFSVSSSSFYLSSFLQKIKTSLVSYRTKRGPDAAFTGNRAEPNRTVWITDLTCCINTSFLLTGFPFAAGPVRINFATKFYTWFVPLGNVSVPETRMTMKTGNVQVDVEPGNNREKTQRFTNTTLFLRKQALNGQVNKGKVENPERTGNTSRLKPGVLLRPGQKRPLPVRMHGMLPKPGTQPEITRRPYRPGIKHFNSSQIGVKGGIVVPSSNRSITRFPLRPNVDSAYPVSDGKPLELTMKETRSQKGNIETMFRIESVETPRSSVHKLTSTPLPFTTEEPTITTEKTWQPMSMGQNVSGRFWSGTRGYMGTCPMAMCCRKTWAL